MDFAERISFIILGAIVIAFGAVVSGTILYYVWEDSITAMFPSAVSAGVLAAKLTWWQSVKIAWIFGLLIKTAVETKQVIERPKPNIIIPPTKPNPLS